MFIPEILPLIKIIQEASSIALEYFQKDYDVFSKDDESPVTEADFAVNEFILSKLSKFTPDIPIITEESESHAQINAQSIFWLVDPIDGTRSFIKRNNDFTINIGLVKNKKPILGIIAVPITGEIYYTENNLAYKRNKEGLAQKIHAKIFDESNIQALIGSSKDKHTLEYLHINNISSFKRISSALKFCLLAEGLADIYPRFGKTMEWDSAAGHAILNAAGGSISQVDGSELEYGKEKFENTHFIAWANKKPYCSNL